MTVSAQWCSSISCFPTYSIFHASVSNCHLKGCSKHGHILKWLFLLHFPKVLEWLNAPCSPALTMSALHCCNNEKLDLGCCDPSAGDHRNRDWWEGKLLSQHYCYSCVINAEEYKHESNLKPSHCVYIEQNFMVVHKMLTQYLWAVVINEDNEVMTSVFWLYIWVFDILIYIYIFSNTS